MKNNIKAIFIVAGHSKYNPGATFSSYKEREYVKKITKNLYNNLSHIDNIYLLGMEDISLKDKVGKINEICRIKGYTVDNSIIIEIHTNAGGGTGIEALGYNGYNNFNTISNILLKEVSKKTGLRNRGIKDGRQFYIINQTIPLAIIFECGFIDNNIDLLILNNNIELFSKGLTNGFLRILGKTIDNKYKKAIEDIKKIINNI